VVKSVDVVVVGAGPSGLRLAGHLIRSGLSVAVLEASNQVGGRLQTVYPGVDLGATWFWNNEDEVFEVIAECGLKTFPQFSLGIMMYQGPNGVAKMQGNPLDHQAQRVVDGMGALASALHALLPDETVKFLTQVTTIDFADQVKVSTNQGEWVSKFIVIALPPATAVETVEITPELPKDLLDIASRTPVWMGAVTKVVAVYEKAFWRTSKIASGINN
jgi:monoamine oxidase